MKNIWCSIHWVVKWNCNKHDRYGSESNSPKYTENQGIDRNENPKMVIPRVIRIVDTLDKRNLLDLKGERLTIPLCSELMSSGREKKMNYMLFTIDDVAMSNLLRPFLRTYSWYKDKKTHINWYKLIFWQTWPSHGWLIQHHWHLISSQINL